MSFRTDIADKITALQTQEAADILMIQTRVAGQVNELQALLNSAEAWLDEDTNAFAARVQKLASKVHT